ncbi:MAG: CPBP family intramembrane metalloprotease [Verrucomicrobiae bacterium]|nr:CPBP family intramembrane metalloprotease [Verrucomicrobiae bacterium]
MSQRVCSWWWLGLAPVLAIVLSPWIYQGVQGVNAIWEGPQWLEEVSFRRVFNRIFLISTLFILVPLLIKKGYRRGEDFGFQSGARKLFFGFLLGLGCVGVLLGWQMAFGIREWDFDLKWSRFLGFFFSAVMVAFLEEPLFRGVFLKELRLRLSLKKAVVISALVFASLHFLSAQGFGEGYQVSWHSGWDYVLSVPGYFFSDSRNGLRWMILFVIGIILAMGVVLFRSIWWGVGLHAGWVLSIKSAPDLVNYIKGPWKGWLPKNLLDGVDCLVLLVILFLGLLLYGKKTRNTLGADC